VNADLSLFKGTVYQFSPETSKGEGRELALLLHSVGGGGEMCFFKAFKGVLFLNELILCQIVIF